MRWWERTHYVDVDVIRTACLWHKLVHVGGSMSMYFRCTAVIQKPRVWLQQAEAEAQFALRNITADNMKYHYFVAALDQTAI